MEVAGQMQRIPSARQSMLYSTARSFDACKHTPACRVTQTSHAHAYVKPPTRQPPPPCHLAAQSMADTCRPTQSPPCSSFRALPANRQLSAETWLHPGGPGGRATVAVRATNARLDSHRSRPRGGCQVPFAPSHTTLACAPAPSPHPHTHPAAQNR